ncbi:MAG: tetratricopeptide repeat protein, partial [Solirubrobacteraceae bacterium]
MGDRIEQLIALGREHYNAGEYARAEPFLAEAVAARPSFPDIYNMLGVLYHAQGRFQEAEEAFETALRLNPRYTEAALNLSVTYNDRGKYDRAREVYSRAVSASKSQPDALDQFARGKLANMHADLGAAYAGLAMFDEAVREYAK